MKKANLLSLGALVVLILVPGMAMAGQGRTILVQFQGPGGHSNGNYGRTSAVHAAARSIMQLQQTDIPADAWWLSDFNGGNSVNSIASDARFKVHLTATGKDAYEKLTEKVKAAVAAGVHAENAFRGVSHGDHVKGGSARTDIRYTITLRGPTTGS